MKASQRGMTMKGMSAARGLRKAGGFALTELLLTIGIIALVLGAVAAIAISTSAGQTAQSDARIIDSAASKIRSVYSSRPNFANLTSQVSTQIEAWPTNMVADATAGTVYNSWGGLVTVKAELVDAAETSYGGQTATRLFTIKTVNVTADACADLATANTSALGIDVNGTAVYDRGADATDGTSDASDPINAALVAAQCAAGDGTTSASEIVFIFGKNG